MWDGCVTPDSWSEHSRCSCTGHYHNLSISKISASILSLCITIKVTLSGWPPNYPTEEIETPVFSVQWSRSSPGWLWSRCYHCWKETRWYHILVQKWKCTAFPQWKTILLQLVLKLRLPLCRSLCGESSHGAGSCKSYAWPPSHGHTSQHRITLRKFFVHMAHMRIGNT